MADPTTVSSTTPSSTLSSTPSSTPSSTGAAAPVDDQIEAARLRRVSLQSKHSQALARLMDERDDLRGVHALADLVADSLRWSA